jgi:hypothetical protein
MNKFGSNYQAVLLESEGGKEYREFVRDTELLPVVGKVERPYRSEKPLMTPLSITIWLDQHPEIDRNLFSYTRPSLRSSYYGICKYGGPHPTVNHRSWEFQRICTFREFYGHLCGSHIVSFEFVITQMKKSTSCGAILNRYFKCKGDFFDHPLCLDFLNDYWALLYHQDKYIHVLKQVSDKYEVRTTEKLKHDPPKVRVFVADGVESVCVGNRFSLDFNNKFYSTSCQHSSSIGRSKYMGGYQTLASMLSRFKLKLSIDISSNDTVQFFLLMMDQVMFRWECFRNEDKTDENWVKFLNYNLSNIISFMHCQDGVILLKQFGECSGSANTLVDNTMRVYRLWCYVFSECWLADNPDRAYLYKYHYDLYKNSTYRDSDRARSMTMIESLRDSEISYDYMQSVICKLLGGDDSIVAVSESIIDWFNFQNISFHFKKLGISITAEFELFRPLEDLTYFSHSFVKINDLNVYLPAPSTDRIFGSLIHGSQSWDPKWNLLRAYALRIESWANLECRNLLVDFIIYIHRNYVEDLHGDMEVPGKPGLTIKMKDIESGHLTDNQLWYLYYGFEGAVPDVSAITAFNSFCILVESLQLNISFSFLSSKFKFLV